MTTNAQAALQAAATFYSPVEGASERNVIDLSITCKAWLDAQDEADREARRKTKRPGGAAYPSALDLIDGDGTAGSARAVVVEAGSGIPRDGRDVIGRRLTGKEVLDSGIAGI